MFLVANLSKVNAKFIPKQVNFAPNWLQDHGLARPDAPSLAEALTANSWPRFWTPFGVPFGCPLKAKSAFKFNLEAIRKECTLCTPKSTALEANLGFKTLDRDLIELISRLPYATRNQNRSKHICFYSENEHWHVTTTIEQRNKSHHFAHARLNKHP